MDKTVLCLLPVQAHHKEKLERAAGSCHFVYAEAETVTEKEINSANIILGLPPTEHMQEPPGLELLQCSSAGVDPYLKPGILQKGTVLCNSSGAYSQAVAEHAFACTLMILKKLHRYRDAQRQNLWTDFGQVTSLEDATVLVVGLGSIGGHYARLVKMLGAYVVGIKRRRADRPEFVDELYTMEALDEQLKRADIIFSAMPSTKETRWVYSSERFKKMKPSAVFINCGRGDAVASEVLYDALSQGIIAAAALDVTDPEPLPNNSNLWALDNLVITPHISGHYHLPATFERVVDIAANNLRRFLAGEELTNVVDFVTGYKK